MFYAQITNGEITRINITLPTSIGNTSIPRGATGLEAFGLYPIVGNEPVYDNRTQRLVGPTYQFDGQQINRVYTVEDISAEELTRKVRAEIVESTQKRLDNFARTKNYDGILSAATYATDPDPKFASEGQRAVELRSATWSKLYEILAEVEAGTRPMPTSFSDIENELPTLEW